MSVGAYILIRFSDLAKLRPAIEVLRACPQVRRWDAVEGHAHLVLKLRVPAASVPASLTNLNGVGELVSYDILADVEQEDILVSQLCHAYLFIECEPAKIGDISLRLDGLEPVVSCSEVSGGCNLVVIVKGASFQAIDRFVNDKIQHLDGILRLKKNRVIDLKQL